MHKKLLAFGAFLGFVLWSVNMLANAFYWYSAMWWFDIPMHILGGFFLAFIVGGFFFNKFKQLHKGEIWIVLLLAVVVLGFGWELFEYLVQYFIKGVDLANIPDSIKDMLMDFIGAVLGIPFVLRALSLYNKAHAN